MLKHIQSLHHQLDILRTTFINEEFNYFNGNPVLEDSLAEVRGDLDRYSQNADTFSMMTHLVLNKLRQRYRVLEARFKYRQDQYFHLLDTYLKAEKAILDKIQAAKEHALEDLYDWQDQMVGFSLKRFPSGYWGIVQYDSILNMKQSYYRVLLLQPCPMEYIEMDELASLTYEAKHLLFPSVGLLLLTNDNSSHPLYPTGAIELDTMIAVDGVHLGKIVQPAIDAAEIAIQKRISEIETLVLTQTVECVAVSKRRRL